MSFARTLAAVALAALLVCVAPFAPAAPVPDESPRDGHDLWGDPLPKGAKARLGTVRLRHGLNLSTAAFAPDGKTVASGGYDRAIRVWEVSGGKQVCAIEGLTGQPLALRYAPSGRTLVASFPDGTLRAWDPTTGKLLWSAAERIVAPVLAWSPDGKSLACPASDGSVLVRNGSDGKLAYRCLGARNAPWEVAFAANGSDILLVGSDMQLRRWEAGTGKPLPSRPLPPMMRPASPLPGHTLAFSPDARSLAIALSGRAVMVWPFASGEAPRQFESSSLSASRCVAFSADGRFLVAGYTDGSVALWGVASGRELRSFPGPNNRVITGLAVSPDGKALAACHQDRQLRLWDLPNGKPLFPDLGGSEVRYVAFANNRTVVTTGYSSGYRAWEALTGRPGEQLREGRTGGYGLVPAGDGKSVVALELNSGLVRWQSGAKPEVGASLALPTPVNFPVELAPDGRTVAYRVPEGLRLRDASTGKDLRTLQLGAKSFVPLGLVFSGDAGLLAVRESGGAVRIWETDPGRALPLLGLNIGGPRNGAPLAFFPGGAMLVSAEADLRLWESASGRERGRFKCLPLATAVGVSPDGRLIFVGTNKGEVAVYDARTGAELLRSDAHRAPVRCFAFSPDGSLAASGSDDTTALVWDAARLRPDSPRAAEPSPGDLSRWWGELAADDPAKAYAAVLSLADAPAESVGFLKEHMKPDPESSADKIAKLIAQVDDNRFRVREAATRELAAYGTEAEAALKAALAKSPSADAKDRIEKLLKRLGDGVPAAGRLRELRVVEALERAGTPEAKELLAALAKGAPDAPLTRAASGALKRLGK